ncbi:sulfate permease [Microbacterium lacus]|uniref:sulfate permease n=1 Tax=Microbacterium lacus TaxID=415217 RepID=UPI00385033C3
MFALIWMLSTRIRFFLRRYAPTNILLAALHTRRGLKWGVPAMLLAVPYLFGVVLCAEAAAHTGDAWLNFLVLLFVWNAVKFIVAGPVCLGQLILVRIREAWADRAARARTLSEGVHLERVAASDDLMPVSSRAAR